MLYNNPFNKLSIYVNTSLTLATSYRVSKVIKNKYAMFGDFEKDLGEKTYNWVISAIRYILYWLETQNINGKYFEKNILDLSVDYLGYYHKRVQPKEFYALNACHYAMGFSCLSMLEYDKKQGNCSEKYFPASLLDNPNRIHYCLAASQQASDNPETEKEWQEKVIARLLQDHYTDNPEEFGENISREYIEELLGEKLPF